MDFAQMGKGEPMDDKRFIRLGVGAELRRLYLHLEEEVEREKREMRKKENRTDGSDDVFE